MKRFRDNELSICDLKNAIKELKGSHDRKNLYIFIGVTITLVMALIAAIIWFSNKNNDNLKDDWEDDWENEDFSEYDLDEKDNEEENSGMCSCSDKDIDKSVKVEKL